MKIRYPGAQPFSTDQKPIFFGREQELDELQRFVHAEQLVVLFAKSGLGKSSLLNAGLIPLVQGEGRLQPVSIRFGAFTESSNSTPLDSSVQSIRDGLDSVAKVLDKIKPAGENSLWYHLKTRQLATNENGYLLVFDQFEELFTYPDEAVQAYGQQLSELLYSNIPDPFRKKLEAGLKANPNFLTDGELQRLHQPFELRVVMAIRSDRMSLMNKLKTFLPNILENCYELRSLTIEEAESAILSPAYLPKKLGPFASPVFDYEDAAVASLIDFLSEVRTQEIESFQLQILCEYVERQVILKQGKTLVAQADIANPDLILENYYLDKINGLPEEDRLPARRLIEEGLVFEEEERRLTLYEGQITRTYGIDPDLLRTLLDTHLIRSEPSLRGGYTYELSHDTLVAPVMKAKAKRKEIESIEEEREMRQRKEAEMEELRRKAEGERKRAEDEKQLREQAERGRRRATIFTVIAVLGLLLAAWQMIEVRKANNKAEEALKEAQTAEKTAKDALVLMENEKRAKEEQRLIAVKKTDEAEDNFRRAEDNLKKAQAEETKTKAALNLVQKQKDATEEQRKKAEENYRIAQVATKKAEAERSKTQAALTQANNLLRYFDFNSNSNYVAFAVQNGLSGLIDTLGNTVNPVERNFIYNEVVSPFSNGISIVSINNQKVLLSYTGSELSKRHNELSYIRPNRYRAESEGYVISHVRDTPSVVYYQKMGVEKNNGLTRVQKNGKWGFINQENIEPISIQFIEIGDFSEGFARVRDSVGWFYIDSTMNRVTNDYFDDAGDFNDGSAVVYFNGEFKVFKSTGKISDEKEGLHTTSTLRLGLIDQGLIPTYLPLFFEIYHAGMSNALKSKLAFRDEGDARWRPLTEIPGNSIFNMQIKLNRLGLFPIIRNNGIFDYYTQSSLRLFQEQVRVLYGEPIGTPDGITGRNTFQFINKYSGQNSLPLLNAQKEEHKIWIDFLQKANKYYLQKNSSGLIKLIDGFKKETDTRLFTNWNVDPNSIHLIGIRRNEDVKAIERENDDIFILLINGMVFKFWGSTDPSQNMAFNVNRNVGRLDEPFLIEGQHEYKLGWHKISDARRVYRALRPVQHGVLVIRDRNNNNALDEEDINMGLEGDPNLSINIHWSGKGQKNWSAGAQVIAGASYIGNNDELVDCSNFASLGYSDLGRDKTRGAYNILIDLLTIFGYQENKENNIYYTLINDDILDVHPRFGKIYADSIYKEMISVLGKPDSISQMSSVDIEDKKYESLFKEFKTVLVNALQVEENEVWWDTDLSIDLGADELDLIEITMALERQYSIDISEDEIESLEKASDWVLFIYNLLK